MKLCDYVNIKNKKFLELGKKRGVKDANKKQNNKKSIS